jgi:tetratricopeptide (TPR) repeat protein
MNLIDELRQIRTFYYLGMYNEVILEANNLPTDFQPHGQLWSLRAQIEMDPLKMAHSLPDEGSIEVRAMKLYAIYRSGDVSLKEQVVQQLSQLVQDPELVANPYLQIFGAYIFLHEKNLRDALQLSLLACGHAEEQLEKLALQALCLLQLGRWDLAEGHVQQIQQLDDDDVLGQLAQAWVGLARADESGLASAARVAAELQERVGGGSAVVHNLLGASLLSQGRHKEAFQSLKLARDWSVQHYNTVDEGTLANTLCTLFHRGGSSAATEDMLAKITAELAQVHPNADILAEQTQLEAAFDKAAAQYP